MVLLAMGAEMKTNRLDQALQYLRDKHYCQYASTYGEPGYNSDQPEKGILFANWNPIPKRMIDWLASQGYACEWSDEWYVDDDGKAWRTQPDCYSWESSLVYCDGDYMTRDDDHADIIECVAMTDWNQPTGCVSSWVTVDDLIDAGYELFAAELESGWFPGQTDDPAAIAKAAFAMPDVERVVFRKTENSQFYCRFECYVSKGETDES
jgi:hypothetical protein